jgi:hypothetical protein
MTEYLSKKAVLEWLTGQYFHGMGEEAWNTAISKLQEKIESGAFDADDSEIQRLRAAINEMRDAIWGEYVPIKVVTKINKIASEALSTATEPTGPYTIRRDEYGHAVAIERNGYTVLHLQPGTERNEQEVENIVALLNSKPPEAHIITEIKGLLENWDFRAIAAELENGYDQGVLVELVELCEKLTGAKSPRANAPEGDGNDA